ncbi:MAG TPA: dienelactone hydrolase family protein [Acidobacteriaceae bacterium]|nr:dienelactone hydrolase family protein [Acidobacteriaceae bacterium]
MTMGEHVAAKASDGNELDLYVARPEGKASAGVVVIQEIFGVNTHMQSVTNRFAQAGYLAATPAMFDRIEKGVELGYDEAGRQKAMSFLPRLDFDAATLDVEAAVAYLHGQGVSKVGVVGYCFGGTMAWLAATRLHVDAAVGYYGGSIRKFAAEKVTAPVMLHFGAKDDHIPPAVAEAAQAANAGIEVYWYEDAGHAFNRDVDPHVYAPEAAALAWERTLAFLKKNLG